MSMRISLILVSGLLVTTGCGDKDGDGFGQESQTGESAAGGGAGAGDGGAGDGGDGASGSDTGGSGDGGETGL